MNLLPIVWQRDAGGARISLGANAIDWNGADAGPQETSRDDLLLGVRPEHFEVVVPEHGADGMPAIAATLEVAERLGDTVLLYVRIDGVEPTVAVKVAEEGRVWQRGARLGLRPRRGSALLFGRSGARVC